MRGRCLAGRFSEPETPVPMLAVALSMLVFPSPSFRAAAEPPVPLAALTVDVRAQGEPMPARVQILDRFGAAHPGAPDPDLLSHLALGGYFYTSGSVTLDVPRGLTTITVGRGFEWQPVRLQVPIVRDTTIVIDMQKPYDMRSRGWFSGDVHTHTRHEPIDYDISPVDAHLVARAEDLALMWCLDQNYAFSGGPHPISDDESILYYSTEYRNQAMGHVSLLGLKRLMGVGCCESPGPVLPSLSDLYLDWRPISGEAMVLGHPHTTDDFWMDAGWPGFGLGRELPVQAALETIDALDLASYSNDPDIYLSDWYALLNSGQRIAPSAGTDALLCAYDNLPPGGYRVYVQEAGGGPPDPASWVEALKAGRSFVTNYPLIPHFSVNGVEAGDTLSLPGSSAAVTVSFRVECAEPLSEAHIHRNGLSAMYTPLGGQHVVERELTLIVTESSWVGLRVYGQRTVNHPVEPLLFAHTAPVFVLLDGEPIGGTLDSGRMLSWIDDLQQFADDRGWTQPEEWSHFAQQLDEARAVYLQNFREPPGEFALLSPAMGDTVPLTGDLLLRWEEAVDPEPGDEVTYFVRFGTDSTLTGLDEPGVATPWFVIPVTKLVGNEVHWWSVRAQDRAGNETLSTPPLAWFYVNGNVVPVEEPSPPTAERSSAWPNPTSGIVRMHVPGSEGGWDGIRVLDVAGRIVAQGSRRDGFPACIRQEGADNVSWTGRDAGGRPVAAGRYWVEFWSESPAPPGSVESPGSSKSPESSKSPGSLASSEALSERESTRAPSRHVIPVALVR